MRKHWLGGMLLAGVVVLLLGSSVALAQGECPDCGQGVPPPPQLPVTALAGDTYITSVDNENNAHTGTSDGDMGTGGSSCVFNGDAVHPIEFNINVSGPLPTQDATLALYAYDVDEPDEVDEVYFEGHLLGTLSGADETWSTNIFAVPTSYVKSGDNLVEIQVDTASEDEWCVGIAWGQLLIDGGSGAKATIDSMSTDEPCYEIGPAVHIEVDFTIDVSAAGNFSLETNVLDPSNVTIASELFSFSPSGPDTINHTYAFDLDETFPPGTYTVNAVLFDDDTGAVESVASLNIEYAEVCEVEEEFVPEPGSIMLLGSGLVGLAGYATLRWRRRE